MIYWNTRTNPQVFIGFDVFHSHVSGQTETVEPEVEETYTGGYEDHPFSYKHHPRYKEKKEVEEIVVDLVKKIDVKPRKRDLEIALRLRLAQKDLEYQNKYLNLLYQEAMREYQRRQREEEEVTLILMML